MPCCHAPEPEAGAAALRSMPYPERAVAECVQQHVWRHDQHVRLLQHRPPLVTVPGRQPLVVHGAMVCPRAEAVRARQCLVTLLQKQAGRRVHKRSHAAHAISVAAAAAMHWQRRADAAAGLLQGPSGLWLVAICFAGCIPSQAPISSSMHCLGPFSCKLFLPNWQCQDSVRACRLVTGAHKHCIKPRREIAAPCCQASCCSPVPRVGLWVP